MEVLCLGFLRTGTATMSTAMETLGMPCWHSLVLLSDNFDNIPMWQEAFARKYKSYMETIVEQTSKPWWHISRIVYFLDRWYFHPIGRLHLTGQEVWVGIKSRKDAEAKIRDKYREYYELVRRVTLKDRLLEFKLSDGWGPLCQFLGKPVPDVPFPHLNETKWFEERSALIFKRALVNVVKKGLMWPLVTVRRGVAWALGANTVKRLPEQVATV
ncbi:hypothetical protein ACHAQH_005262 [Verticillium albo-atrum]